ncbi:NAD(P)H-binding protein [Pseudomonas sp. NPDC008258]|uniref:SDR family oxidoreductase n=1 Tax=Pseudomonas sp. NPDC008258 TaxID=3364418 RepID=UPI0036EA6980
MSSVFIVGGAGKIGRRLIQHLVLRGHKPVAMHRQIHQGTELERLGALPVNGSLQELTVDHLARLMSGCDVVIFTAGAGGKGGPEMTNAIDGRGLELSVEAATLAGIKRFLLVSAFPEAGRGKHVSDTFENYMAVKKRADVYLAQSSLDWAILRPGTLTDQPGSGLVRVGLVIPYGEVSREDVAATLVGLVEKPQLARVVLELTQGNTPVDEALVLFASGQVAIS